MNVYVERCFSGEYRLTIISRRSSHFGERYFVLGDTYGDWTREVASRAKLIVSAETGVSTKNIRFTHH